ncbi:MAG: class I SAM-dependent methyltransferase [Planctomycetota bacterium]
MSHPRNEWEEFFDLHAPMYMENSFTRNTLAEVDIVEGTLQLRPGARLLDIGCGTGRHAVELARRGYRVTGVDLSSGMLEQACAAAEAAGVSVEWVHADATTYRAREPFDAALMLCEGAFGLIGRDGNALEQPRTILRGLRDALRPGGRLIATVLNGLALIRRMQAADVASGRFDPATLSETSLAEIETASGRKSFKVRERAFVPTELVMLFTEAGFEVEHLGGGTAGQWGYRPLELDEMEIMIIARRREGP